MELNSVDFNKIAIFCQVVESGNYQRASEVLHVTPSALSQTITSLEHSLGFLLFDRQGRKLVPTKDGLRVHREFRHHQTGFIRALREVKGHQADVSGTLRVGAYLEFAKTRLSAPINEFIQRHSNANIKMVFDSPTRLQHLLNHGMLDLCFSIFPSKEKKTVSSKPLREEELVLISSLHKIPENPTFEQLMKVSMVDYYFNHQPIRRWIALHYDKRPKKIPVRVFAATAEMVVALIKEGAGAGVVPRYLVSQTDATLRVVRPTNKRLTDYVWLLERAGTERSNVHAEFQKIILRHFRPLQGQ